MFYFRKFSIGGQQLFLRHKSKWLKTTKGEDKIMKKNLRNLALLLVVCLLVGCGGAGAGGGDTLTIALSGDSISLDPVLTNDNQSSNAMAQIYEGLVKIDDKV